MELQIVISILGLLPGLFINIAGGSAIFFSDIQHWTAFLFLPYYLKFLVSDISWAKTIYKFSSILFIPVFFNCFWCLDQLLKDNYNAKKNIFGPGEYYSVNVTTRELIAHRSILWDQKIVEKLDNNADYSKLKYLVSIDTMSNKENRILYIEDKDFLSKYFTCIKAPFFSAGVTGMSLLNGYWVGTCYWSDYGVEYYKEYRPIPEDGDLCKMLRNPIFKEIVSVNIENRSLKVIKCKSE